MTHIAETKPPAASDSFVLNILSTRAQHRRQLLIDSENGILHEIKLNKNGNSSIAIYLHEDVLYSWKLDSTPVAT